MLAKKITKILLLLSVGVFLFGSGYKFGEYKTKLSSIQQLTNKVVNSAKESASFSNKNLDFTLFWDAWDRLEQKFIDKNKIIPQKMFYGAIKGMVTSLDDPYTFFLTPEENKESKRDLEGKFEGIGAQLGLKDNRIVIVSPLKNSPAKNAGIKAGDFINKVDNQSTKGWTLPQAVAKIRGPKGTKVKLTLERDSKELDFTIVRDQINVESVELTYEIKKNQTVAIIKLNQFGDNTQDEWDKAVDNVFSRWMRKEVKGLIVDVRDNPGGYLEGSVYIASEFIPRDKLVVKQESTISDSQSHKVTRQGSLLDIPLVVIINKGSASASEILSGALRDYKRAKLVGEKTFGKGSVQEAIDLKDGAGLHVTVAKWILPNGDWINGKGIEPDVSVENDLKNGDSLTRKSDKQLEKAIDLLVQ